MLSRLVKFKKGDNYEDLEGDQIDMDITDPKMRQIASTEGSGDFTDINTLRERNSNPSYDSSHQGEPTEGKTWIRFDLYIRDLHLHTPVTTTQFC